MSEIESRPELDGADEPVNYKSVEYSDLTLPEPRPRMIHRHFYVAGLDGVERVRRQIVAPIVSNEVRNRREDRTAARDADAFLRSLGKEEK